MELPPLEIGFDQDFDVVPDDYNAFSAWSLRFVTIAEIEHRTADGSHVSRSIPEASANVTAAAANDKVDNLACTGHPAVGRYSMTLAITMRSTDEYFALAWPRCIDGTVAYFAFESQHAAGKTTTTFEIEIRDYNNAPVDVDFYVEVYGPRAGEVV
jgi:hypothetical protein